MEAFAVLAAPARRRIVAELRRSSRSVNELAASLDERQPMISKHLKVLREAGFVSCRGEAQHRIYQLEPAPFQELAAWLTPYVRLWNRHLDALASFLDTMESPDVSQPVSSRRPRRRRRRP